ncbi:winged helix-turn-helix transcriptional regulator [Montanilutibacter psychrotolerans]|uniref:Transcriptional regulator n=1 Tax=Montanilutibacter psychrotolerans TaxID=1327343 RepID=A0A3M8SV27_9GAMM|nr:helix-turn-helix domain-containing protein [Lysobacter psychrotolerans]RNF83084.1 transcriptional regulator [Lysobacter psychrotolerans]
MSRRTPAANRPRSESPAYVCPVDITLSVIRGKWKPLILWLLSDGAMRFSELEAAIPQIAHKVLSQQLRQLERNGVIHRTAQPASQTAAYELTTFGQSLGPALTALAEWGKRHQDQLADVVPG